MKSFAEFIAVRDPEMLVEFVRYAENMISEAEEPAQKTWWRSSADRFKKYLLPAVAGLGMAQGFAGAAQAGDTGTGTQEAPTSQIGGEGGNLIKAWNPETKSYEMVPASETNKDPFTGVTFVKPKAKPAQDPLMNFADEPEEPKENPIKPAANLNAKFASYVVKLKNGTLSPTELDSILKGQNDVYNAAYQLAHQEGGDKNPAFDEAVKFVLEVENIKQQGKELIGRQAGQKVADFLGKKIFGSVPKTK